MVSRIERGWLYVQNRALPQSATIGVFGEEIVKLNMLLGDWTVTVPSSGVTKRLLGKLLKAQARRAERKRKMSFAKKLRVLDELMSEGAPRVEEVLEPSNPVEGHHT